MEYLSLSVKPQRALDAASSSFECPRQFIFPQEQLRSSPLPVKKCEPGGAAWSWKVPLVVKDDS